MSDVTASSWGLARELLKPRQEPTENAMKKQSRKLNLNRETLAPMRSDDLANVNGGRIREPTLTNTTMPETSCFPTFGGCKSQWCPDR
jgi:hypothetical protein